MEIRPWPRKAMLLTAPFMYAAVLLGGYILWDKSMIALIAYLLIWLGFSPLAAILSADRVYIMARIVQPDSAIWFGSFPRIIEENSVDAPV